MIERLGLFLDRVLPLSERLDDSRTYGVEVDGSYVGKRGVALCWGRWIVTVRQPR